MSVSYLSPKARPVPVGATGRAAVAAVAAEPFAAGELVVAFGGRVMTRDEFDLLPESQRSRSVQIEDILFLAGAPDPEPGDFIHHSCEPNCGMRGATVVVAMRDIEVGETLTYDFATSDGSDFDDFECRCGSPRCRGRVTGDDWMLPELQLRYRGYFAPYLARRIADLHHVGGQRRAFAY